MVERFILILSIVFVPAKAWAGDDIIKNGKEVSIQESEIIVKKADLAVHMGLVDQEIIFGTPRTFRSEAMDQVAIEPMDADAEANSGS